MYKVIVTTCDRHLWTVRPFAYLFNVYWSELQPVTLLCESQPRFRLPENFIIKSMGVPWAKKRFTDPLINYLKSITDPYIVWLLDDYWFIRTVDNVGIKTLIDYMTINPNVLRIDLTNDRLFARGDARNVEDCGSFGHYDLISAPGAQYQMSLQAGIWNRERLLEILKPNWSPWDVELSGTTLVNNRPELVVLGTRQWPIRYINGLKNESKTINKEGLPSEHRERLEGLGWLSGIKGM